MKVTQFTKDILKARKHDKPFRDAGYLQCEPHWQLLRGGDWDKHLVDCAISGDGKHIWYKISE